MGVAGGMLRRLVPDLVIEKVEALTPPMVLSLGVAGLLLDVDCTLKPYRARAVSANVVQWAEELRRHGVALMLVSNGRKHRVLPIAEQLALPWIAPALKPFPFALWRAARKLGLQRSEVAMVGDQIFADVLAARWAGMKSILVRPISPGQEPWWSRWKRPLERCLLGRDLARSEESSAEECCGKESVPEASSAAEPVPQRTNRTED